MINFVPLIKHVSVQDHVVPGGRGNCIPVFSEELLVTVPFFYWEDITFTTTHHLVITDLLMIMSIN